MSGGFDSLGLMPELVRAVAEMEWNLPTDVQDEAIPLILGGGDVMVASETGSGKTAAFSLPMIQCVHERIRDSSKEVSVKTCASASIQIKLNINDKDSMCDILENGHACYSGSKNWCGCRATHGVRKGRCYYEALIRGDGICRVGWSTMAAHYEIGKDKQGYGFGGTSKKSFNSTFVEYGSKFGDNDVIGCSIDLDCNPGTISFSKNGVDLGVAFEIAANLKGSTFFPAIVCKGAGVRASFGGDSGALKYPPKSPYVALGNMCANNPSDVISSSSKSAFDNHSSNSKFKSGRTPLAIIVEPSLELAHQVYENMNQFVKYVSDPNLLVSLMVGGDGKHRNTYSSQNCDIVIGTPGKLNDMVKREALDLSKIKFFILDEADRFTSADPENMEIILNLYQRCPKGGVGENRLQVSFFSATLHSPEITDLASKICDKPCWVDLKGQDAVPETVHHTIYRMDLERDLALYKDHGGVKAITDGLHKCMPKNHCNDKLLKSQQIKELKQYILLNILNHYKMSQCLIFCRTNLDCNNLEKFLLEVGGGKRFNAQSETGKENPYSCCVLAGMRSKRERQENLEAFQNGAVRFLICTDVAARGLDIKNLPYVINMSLPDKSEDYVHRIGRVGRADRMGLAMSIVAPVDAEERVWYHSNCRDKTTCSNTGLVTEGGCTIWYNETQLLTAIEDRLHLDLEGSSHIPLLQVPSLALPEIYQKMNICYGDTTLNETDNSGSTNVMLIAQNKRIEALQGKVKELASLEYDVQNHFLLMQQSYANIRNAEDVATRKK